MRTAVQIAEIVEARTATVTDDFYVPVTVNWLGPERIGVPLLATIEDSVEGYSGGHLTVKLEPLTGEVAGVVVTKAPRTAPRVGFVPPARLTTVAGSIRVDRTPWDLNPDQVARREVVGEPSPLTVYTDEHHVHFGFSEIPSEKKVMAGPAGFTVAEDGVLTGLVIERGATDFGR